MKLHHAYDKRKGNEMKLRNEKEVKTWLRKLPLLKKELELKIDFYTELVADFEKTSSYGKHVDYYNEKIDELIQKLLENCADAVSICGAGGGGYLLVVLKEDVTAEKVQQFIESNFEAIGGKVKRLDISY